MVYLCDISDTFRIKGRGLAIVVYIDETTPAFAIGDELEFRPLSSEPVRAKLRAIESICVNPEVAQGRTVVGLYVSGALPMDACQKGVGIWKVD